MKKNLLGIVLCPISIISVVGVGFSGFVFDVEASKSLETELKVAEVETGEPIDALENPTLVIFTFGEKGFLMSDGSFNTIGSATNAISGGLVTIQSSININLAKEVVNSLNEDNHFMNIIASLYGYNGDEKLSLQGLVSANSTSLICDEGMTLINTTYANSDEIKVTSKVKVQDLTSTNISFSFLIGLESETYSTFYQLYSQEDYGFKATLEVNEA